jgi:hypothetical protein
MFTVLVAFLAGGLGGGVATVLLSRLRVQHSSNALVLDPELEQQIAAAAQQWAAAHGQPAAASLVADKLRLAYVLSQRPRRRRRRWSR